MNKLPAIFLDDDAFEAGDSLVDKSGVLMGTPITPINKRQIANPSK